MPRLDDPTEWATIKSIYFKDNRPLNEEIDSIEKLERLEAKQRNQNKTSR